MRENKTGKYLKYAVGEIVLVVIGILIAIQINNWNEKRKSDYNLKTYYSQILEEVKKDTSNIQQRIIQLGSSMSSYEEYVDKFQKQVSLESLITSQAGLQLTPRLLVFNTNTIETLKTTGDIKLMPIEIRNKLLDLKNKQEAWIEVVSENNSLVAKEIMTVINLGLSNNVLNSVNVQPSSIFNQLRVKENFPKIALVLNGTLGLKYRTEKDLKEGLEKMLIEINNLSETIRVKLEK